MKALIYRCTEKTSNGKDTRMGIDIHFCEVEKKMNDETLVSRMQIGDKDAFDEVYTKYRQQIMKMAYLIVGNVPDAEDLAQETFITCYLHCKELKDGKQLKSWLFRILTRSAWKCSEKKKRELPDEDIGTKADKAYDALVLDHVILSEQKTEIARAVAELDMKYRVVVILYYYNQLSTKEISNILECMEGTVKSRLFGARKKLRKSLKGLDSSFDKKKDKDESREEMSYEKKCI